MCVVPDAANCGADDVKPCTSRRDISNCNRHPGKNRFAARSRFLRPSLSVGSARHCLVWSCCGAGRLEFPQPLCWDGKRTESFPSVSLAGTGITHFSLIDTVTAAQILSATADVLLPPMREVARWLLPLLAVGWALASGFGRSLVLRRYDPSLRSAPWMMVGLQLLRIVVLGSSVALWFAGLHQAAWNSLSGPEPSLVLYFVQAIALSFGIFFFWALVSWVFGVAPLLALLEGTGMIASLRNSLRFGQGSLRGLRSKLVEINLVLGVVKAALIVLAMVFCATPVPFKEEINGTSLYVWWAMVSVWYCVASDFFQVARIIGFMEIWRAANHPQPREIPSPIATAAN